MESIIAAATNTNRLDKSKNEDCHLAKEIKELSSSIILVADGVGSCKYAQISSRTVAGSFISQIENLKEIDKLDFYAFFEIARNELIKLKGDGKEGDGLYGTTLIALIETDKKIKISYVGNGAIWHIRGGFSSQYPWNAVNLLNPHNITNSQGKAVFYQSFSDKPNIDCTPTVMEIEKDDIQGDIFMVCSDGIYTEDEREVCKDANELPLVMIEKAIQEFFVHLKGFFMGVGPYTNDKLEETLKKYLDKIHPELEDDATLGVLITKTAIDYQSNIRQQDEDHKRN